MVPEKLGKLLVQGNLISEDNYQKALVSHKKDGGIFDSVLVKMGAIEEIKLLQFLSTQLRLPYIDLTKVEIESSVIKLVPSELVQKYKIIPVKRSGALLHIAMIDPSNIFAIDDIKFMTGYDVSPVLASESGILSAMTKYYNSSDQINTMLQDIEEEEVDVLQDEDDDVDLNKLKAEVEDAPVIKLVNLILTEAIKKGVSDIHIECYEKKFRVRYRLDGELQEVMAPPMKLKAALTSRIKIMSNLDISERRLPQDGRIKLKMTEKEVDLRVSILPCLFGEKIVMRILDKGNLNVDLKKLGFEPKAMENFLKAIESPWGMVLVTGPTGSGKTTTLYSAMHHINTVDINIMTAEDPVEYNLEGINQVQMKEDIGLNFAAALRSFLRQDPDVVMVGEIRDFETAEIAVKAALTGHLVLSTLHTNDAPGTINRLLNMGIEPFMVASSCVLILAQRLVRRVCQQCKEVEKVPAETLILMGFSKEEAGSIVCYKGKGCTACSNKGYKGRLGLYEVLPVGDEIKALILQGANADELKKKAIAVGMKTLRMSGLEKIREGLTSVEEVEGSTFTD
ncbi:MAG: type IV-A pilus assembly ATPase PilB [Nitrospirae bacterium]|nr:type IV-A pilus assembly ATPase PilB [Nitrospirota bacterium]MBI3594724.1 type IV-A pilus assembly ATPase PilB [Nitrospirota bacterium]